MPPPAQRMRHGPDFGSPRGPLAPGAIRRYNNDSLRPVDTRMPRRRRNTPDYNRSNRIPALKFKPTSEERSIASELIRTERAGPREAHGQKLLNAICRRLRLPSVRLRVQDAHQPHKKSDGRLAYKEYGAYYLDEQVIRIANLTAVRGKVVAGKTFFDTLIHEFMHHIDRKLLNLSSTPHSPGFYNRIDDLKRKLLGGGPAASPEDIRDRQWEAPPKGLLAAVERAAREAKAERRGDERGDEAKAAPVGARVPRWSRDLFSDAGNRSLPTGGGEPGAHPPDTPELSDPAPAKPKKPPPAESRQLPLLFRD